LSFAESISQMNKLGYTEVFNTDGNSKAFFIKQILAGAFITITMTGIDQEMMQKSLSVTRLKDSQKNMVVLGFILVGVISLFLFMGGLLHLYGNTEHVTSAGDQLFPDIALNHMPPFISNIFIIALI
jgi:Na+/proline symporter